MNGGERQYATVGYYGGCKRPPCEAGRRSDGGIARPLVPDDDQIGEVFPDLAVGHVLPLERITGGFHQAADFGAHGIGRLGGSGRKYSEVFRAAGQNGEDTRDGAK
jgi:hypothetical protein